ncbi:hypothetical protein BCT69_14175 [Enterovibrio norvegicus]|nr:hypothetical protein BCT69_14175 [Enterovibrio norvegicus]
MDSVDVDTTVGVLSFGREEKKNKKEKKKETKRQIQKGPGGPGLIIFVSADFGFTLHVRWARYSVGGTTAVEMRSKSRLQVVRVLR